MRARMFGLPITAFHRLVHGQATMRVKMAGAFSIVDARGDAMDRSETVTLFNDMCLLAAGTLMGRRDGRYRMKSLRTGEFTLELASYNLTAEASSRSRN